MALSAPRGAGLARCRFDGDDAPGAPRVYALPAAPAATGEAPEAARAQARRQARQALRGLLADALGGAPESVALSDVRGQPVRVAGRPDIGLSISHERGLSLLALRPGGAVGVDVVASGAAGAVGDWRRVAALYLPPVEAAALDRPDAPEAWRAAFHQAWARHEARLKCIGQPLAEWSPALGARLARLCTTTVALPDWVDGPHATAVAWLGG